MNDSKIIGTMSGYREGDWRRLEKSGKDGEKLGERSERRSRKGGKRRLFGEREEGEKDSREGGKKG